MTKSEIVNEISLRTGADGKEVLQIMEGFMDSVKTSLANGENVYLRVFGSFVVKYCVKSTFCCICMDYNGNTKGGECQNKKVNNSHTADVILNINKYKNIRQMKTRIMLLTISVLFAVSCTNNRQNKETCSERKSDYEA